MDPTTSASTHPGPSVFEGILHGNLDRYVFLVDDLAWDELDHGIDTRERRLAPPLLRMARHRPDRLHARLRAADRARARRRPPSTGWTTSTRAASIHERAVARAELRRLRGAPLPSACRAWPRNRESADLLPNLVAVQTTGAIVVERHRFWHGLRRRRLHPRRPERAAWPNEERFCRTWCSPCAPRRIAQLLRRGATPASMLLYPDQAAAAGRAAGRAGPRADLGFRPG